MGGKRTLAAQASKIQADQEEIPLCLSQVSKEQQFKMYRSEHAPPWLTLYRPPFGARRDAKPGSNRTSAAPKLARSSGAPSTKAALERQNDHIFPAELVLGCH